MTVTSTIEPAHGTIVRYVKLRCRCPMCQANWDLACRDRELYGEVPDDGSLKVSARAASDRVNQMLDMGFEVSAIADAAHVASSTVAAIAGGKQHQIRRTTSDALLDLDPSKPIPFHRVPNVIVARMLGEMRSYGLTLQWIYKTAGVSPKFRGNYSGTRVSWDNYVKLKRVHDLLNESGLLEGVDDGETA